MKPFTFKSMLLLQRADEALRLEREKPRPDARLLALLQRKRRALAARVSRSFDSPALTGA